MKGMASQAVKPGRLLRWADNRKIKRSLPAAVLHGLTRICLICLREFARNKLPLRSAALTYTTLLSLVPILAMSTAVIKGLGGGNHLRETAYQYLAAVEKNPAFFQVKAASEHKQAGSLPELGKESQGHAAGKNLLAGYLRSAIDQIFAYVDRTNFAAIGTFGVLGMLISALLVFNHVETAMNAIWQAENSRPFLRKISDYLTMMLLMPLSINIAFASSAVLSSQNLSSRLDMLLPAVWIQALLLKLVPLFLITITLFIIYLFFPNTRVKSAPALIGALIGALFWLAAQNIYISMQIGMANYNAIYGSFASLPLFLIWIYMGWLFILFGAQTGCAVQNRNTYNLITRSSEVSLKLSAAFDMMMEVHRHHRQGKAARMEEIYLKLAGYCPLTVDETVKLLLEQKLLYQTGRGCLLPGKPEAELEDGDIIRAVMGCKTPDTAGGGKSKKLLARMAADYNLSQ
ncbi:MAG: ribonuclease BN [Deltaproteobacteria bacterium]|nr:MAG: ribonuclease BN [Deltaproteobacteria bacterium]